MTLPTNIDATYADTGAPSAQVHQQHHDTLHATVNKIQFGTGTPEAVVTGSVGDLFLRTDGVAGTALYVKESGNGTNTGWVAFLGAHTAAADPHTGYTKETERLIVATFSKTGTLAVGTGAFRWYNDFGAALLVKAVRASVGTAPTGASLIVDINEIGTTLYTTQANRPTIAVSTNTVDATLPDDTSIADNNYLTVDIDQVGSTVAGADLVVQVWMSLA